MILNIWILPTHFDGCESDAIMTDLLAAFVKRKYGELPEVMRRKVCRSCLENMEVLLAIASYDLSHPKP